MNNRFSQADVSAGKISYHHSQREIGVSSERDMFQLVFTDQVMSFPVFANFVQFLVTQFVNFVPFLFTLSADFVQFLFTPIFSASNQTVVRKC